MSWHPPGHMPTNILDPQVLAQQIQELQTNLNSTNPAAAYDNLHNINLIVTVKSGGQVKPGP